MWFFFFFFFRSASLNDKEVPVAPPAGRRKLSLFRSMSESHDDVVPATPVKSPVSKPKAGWFFENIPLSNPYQMTMLL